MAAVVEEAEERRAKEMDAELWEKKYQAVKRKCREYEEV